MQTSLKTLPTVSQNTPPHQGNVHKDRLKAAMRRMPGTVSLITTVDSNGNPAGLAASAIIPVSMDPPSMLISINKSASACEPIDRSGRFCINLLAIDQTELVTPFASSARRDERFTTSDWSNQDGVPYLPTALAAIFCQVRRDLSFGSHKLFIGEVCNILGGENASIPLGWIEGGFARMDRIDAYT